MKFNLFFHSRFFCSVQIKLTLKLAFTMSVRFTRRIHQTKRWIEKETQHIIWWVTDSVLSFISQFSFITQSVLQLNLNITSSCTWSFYDIIETIFITIIHITVQNLQAFFMLLFKAECDDHLEIKVLIMRLLQELVSISWLRWCIKSSVSLISQHCCKNHHWWVNWHLIFTLKDLNLHCHEVEWVLLCCLSLSWWLSCSAEDEKFEWWKHCCSWSQWISKNAQEEDVNEEDEI